MRTHKHVLLSMLLLMVAGMPVNDPVSTVQPEEPKPLQNMSRDIDCVSSSQQQENRDNAFLEIACFPCMLGCTLAGFAATACCVPVQLASRLCCRTRPDEFGEDVAASGASAGNTHVDLNSSGNNQVGLMSAGNTKVGLMSSGNTQRALAAKSASLGNSLLDLGTSAIESAASNENGNAQSLEPMALSSKDNESVSDFDGSVESKRWKSAGSIPLRRRKSVDSVPLRSINSEFRTKNSDAADEADSFSLNSKDGSNPDNSHETIDLHSVDSIITPIKIDSDIDDEADSPSLNSDDGPKPDDYLQSVESVRTPIKE